MLLFDPPPPPPPHSKVLHALARVCRTAYSELELNQSQPSFSKWNYERIPYRYSADVTLVACVWSSHSTDWAPTGVYAEQGKYTRSCSGQRIWSRETGSTVLSRVGPWKNIALLYVFCFSLYFRHFLRSPWTVKTKTGYQPGMVANFLLLSYYFVTINQRFSAR